MDKKFNIKEWKDTQETPDRIDEYTSNNFTNLEANGWDIKQAFEYMEDNPLAKANLKSVTNLKNSTLKKVNALIKYLLKAGKSKKTEGAIQESSNFGPHAQAGKALNGQKIKEVYYDMGTYYIELANGKYISFDVGGMMPTIGKASALKGM